MTLICVVVIYSRLIWISNTKPSAAASKEPVGSELFGDDLTERLKTVKESKKAAQQLTKQKGEFSSSNGSHNYNNNYKRPFLFQRRGRAYQGRPHGRGNYNNYYQKERNYQYVKTSKPQKQK